MHSHGNNGRASMLLALIVPALLACLAAATSAAHAAPVVYTADIAGVDDAALLDLLVAVSDTLATPPAPPASVLHLNRRAERDRDRFLEVFQSQAHYGATVRVEIDRVSVPVLVHFVADPGPAYTFGDLRIDPTVQFGAASPPLPTPQDVGLMQGEPARAEVIAAGDTKILRYLREHGFPAASIAHRDVVVYKDSQTVAVTYSVDPGAAAQFGELRLSGLGDVHPELIQKILTWAPGDMYDERKMTLLRRDLYSTGLFSTATVTPLTEEIANDGRVPVLVEVVERKQHTMAIGLEYNTDIGAGTQARWEDRNIRGLGRRLSVDAAFSMEFRDLELRYRVDHFRRNDQSLTFSAGLTQEERDAYDSDRFTALALIEREVSKQLTLGVGAGFRLSQVHQDKDTDEFQLIYTPLTAAWDRSNDRLNPSSGFRLNARAEPYADLFSSRSLFIKGQLEATNYLGFGPIQGTEGAPQDNWVFATRLKLGVLLGESRDGVPADIRYYAGGGGSVRGYAFQTVSPLRGDTPLGGNSLTEISLEIRKRITNNIGAVAFVDGGSAFESSVPDFSSAMQFGAGVGLRYFTPVGPLRLDLAVPVNRRDGVDDAFQIYLSIGQAF